jgi:hypothetical protein
VIFEASGLFSVRQGQAFLEKAWPFLLRRKEMKHWPLMVVIFYALCIALLAFILCAVAFAPLPGMQKEVKAEQQDNPRFAVLAWWPYWASFVLLILAQAAFLFLPIKIVRQRPTTKRAVLFPALASGLAMALLFAGFAWAISETIAQDALDKKVGMAVVITLLVAWSFWASIFYRWAKKLTPLNFMEKQCRYLFRGSILELLVAVPTHVVARVRDYCCAGFGTFFGIVFGVAVMLFSLGPGVFFLYAERWKKLKRQA